MRTNKEQMTSLERVMVALSLKEPDRVGYPCSKGFCHPICGIQTFRMYL